VAGEVSLLPDIHQKCRARCKARMHQLNQKISPEPPEII
jgi:hypothetical protein